MTPGNQGGKGKQPKSAAYGPAKKKPASYQSFAADKQPRRIADPDDPTWRERKPRWAFADVDHDGDWCFDSMDTAKLIEVLGKLGNIESMTWKELLAPDNILAKQYEVEKMPAHAQKRLTEIDRADLTQLVRFQLNGKNRLYGFLIEHVFHVLWWDPLHEVWPSKLRHT